MVIIAFFVGHWVSSIFSQTFFLHRYGAHKQFTMSKGWERFFHLFTYVDAGRELLVARAATRSCTACITHTATRRRIRTRRRTTATSTR